MSENPEKVTVPKLTVDVELLNELQELFQKAEDQKERYDFTWNGKAKAYFEAATPSTKTLRAQPEESVNFDDTENLFITGDNLEALKLLQESYLNKIDVIYIDPPYNTGKDFVYHDNFTKSQKEADLAEGKVDEDGNRLIKNEKSAGRYHSDWLSMMYPRLKLARNLLSEQGVIFVSIDDNEQANLKQLMDEVFGEDNFIGNVTVENNPKGRKNSKFISVSSEYAVIYAKNKNDIFFKENIPKESSKMTQDENGDFIHGSGKRILVGENSFNKYITDFNSNKHYITYYNENNNELIIKKENSLNEIDLKLTNLGFKRYVSTYNNKFVENTYTKDKFLELFESNSLDFKDEKIFEKNFSNTTRIKSIVTSLKYDAIVDNKKVPYNLDIKTTTANQYLKKLFNDVGVFEAPKSIDLIKLFLSLFEDKNITVLDFFAGSATTADAVINLNKNDRGTRKYILVTLAELVPEKSKAKLEGFNSIDQISRERIRRAADKIGDTSGFRALKIEDLGIRNDVFKTANETDQTTLLVDLVSNKVSSLTDYDLLYSVLIDGALEYNRKIEKQVVADSEIIKYDYFGELSGLVAYFGSEMSDELVRDIAAMKPLIAVFKEDTFTKSAQKVNVLEQFRVISPDTKVKVI